MIEQRAGVAVRLVLRHGRITHDPRRAERGEERLGGVCRVEPRPVAQLDRGGQVAEGLEQPGEVVARRRLVVKTRRELHEQRRQPSRLGQRRDALTKQVNIGARDVPLVDATALQVHVRMRELLVELHGELEVVGRAPAPALGERDLRHPIERGVDLDAPEPPGVERQLVEPTWPRLRIEHAIPRALAARIAPTGSTYEKRHVGYRKQRTGYGKQLRATGYGLRRHGYGGQPTGYGKQTTANGKQPTADGPGYGLSATGNRLQQTDDGRRVTGYGEQPTGYREQTTENGKRATADGLRETAYGRRQANNGTEDGTGRWTGPGRP